LRSQAPRHRPTSPASSCRIRNCSTILVDIAAGKLFDGADAEKLKRVFGAFAMTDTDSRMKAVEGLDPNDKIFQTRFYRRLRLCPQEVAEARAAFEREIRPHIVAAKK
jgi:hypothetical protein